MWPGAAARIVLTDDNGVALAKVRARYLGDAAISETGSNEARLNRLRSGENPNHLALSALASAGARLLSTLSSLAALSSLTILTARTSRAALAIFVALALTLSLGIGSTGLLFLTLSV